MKKLLLLFTLMVGVVASAQWKEIEGKDEFGDLNGKIRNVYHSVGIFSNSATVGSKASIMFEKLDGYVGFVLADYSGATNTYYKHTFSISVKKVDGTKYKGFKAVNTYSAYSGYKSVKWIGFSDLNPENLSVEEAKIRLKAFKKLYGGALKAATWSTEAALEFAMLKNVISGITTDPMFHVLTNLGPGDLVIIKEGTSTYKFEL